MGAYRSRASTTRDHLRRRSLGHRGDHFDLVGVEGGIGGHDGDVQDHRLSDEKRVKRIAMVVRQPCGLQRVRVLDGKRLDPIVSQANGNELVGMLGKVELPE